MLNGRYVFVYDGPVLHFDKCICQRWHGETIASSEKQARNNLAYRYKMENGLSTRSMLYLPSKLKCMEVSLNGGIQIEFSQI